MDMTTRFRKLAIPLRLTTLLLAAVVILPGCSHKEEAPPPEVVRPAKIMTVTPTPDTTTLQYPGKVRALDRVELSFEVSGRVVDLPIREGQHIRKGDVIARLDPSDFQSRLDAAQARVNQAKAELDRYSNLLAEKVVAKSTYDVKKRNYEVALSDMEIARKALNDATLRAAFSGIIGKKFIDNYQVVQAKQPIVSLQRTSAVEVVVNAPENIMRRRTKDAVLTIKAEFANYPGELMPLTIKEYATEADPQTQTYQVVLRMPTPKDKTILDGMTATVYFTMKKPGGGRIVVPVGAVFYDENNQGYVWIVGQDMRVKKQAVSVGHLGNGEIEITAGLFGGERIVTAGTQKIHEGTKVREFTGTVGE